MDRAGARVLFKQPKAPVTSGHQVLAVGLRVGLPATHLVDQGVPGEAQVVLPQVSLTQSDEVVSHGIIKRVAHGFTKVDDPAHRLAFRVVFPPPNEWFP
jgi:hypothetical protein